MKRLALILTPVVFLLPFYVSAKSVNGRVIADFVPKSLGFKVGDGDGAFSILDSDRVVIANGNELYVINYNRIERKIQAPLPVDNFDITRRGNGILVCHQFGYTADQENGIPPPTLFWVEHFQVDPRSIRLKLPEGGFILSIDMMNDSTVRIMPNSPPIVIVAKVDSLLRDSEYEVLNDPLSQLIAQGDYIGYYGKEHLFLEFGTEEGRMITSVASFGLEGKTPIHLRSFVLGTLGEPIPFSSCIRFDEARGVFYVLLVDRGRIKVREFSIHSILRIRQ